MADTKTDTNYDTWTWREIQTAVLGAVDDSWKAINFATTGISSPNSFYQAGNTFYMTLVGLQTINLTLNDSVKALVGGDSAVWTGKTADQFNTLMKRILATLDGHTKPLLGPPEYHTSLDTAGVALATAMVNIQTINEWGAAEAAAYLNQRHQHPPKRNADGTQIWAVSSVPGLVGKLDQKMRDEMNKLVTVYRKATGDMPGPTAAPPPSPNDNTPPPQPPPNQPPPTTIKFPSNNVPPPPNLPTNIGTPNLVPPPNFPGGLGGATVPALPNPPLLPTPGLVGNPPGLGDVPGLLTPNGVPGLGDPNLITPGGVPGLGDPNLITPGGVPGIGGPGSGVPGVPGLPGSSGLVTPGQSGLVPPGGGGPVLPGGGPVPPGSSGPGGGVVPVPGTNGFTVPAGQGGGVSGPGASGGSTVGPTVEPEVPPVGAQAGLVSSGGTPARSLLNSPTGTGNPGMIPAGAGGGGGAPAGGGREQERERGTWLREDESVWGTEANAGIGVIGAG